MHALLHRAIVMVLVLVAAAVPALAQGMGSVSGRVTDERGVPLPGAEITLTGQAILGSMSAVAGEDGRFIVPGVPCHHPLRVTAKTSDRVSVTYNGHRARCGGTTSIGFTLRRPGDHDILVLVEGGVPYHQTALDGARSTMPGRISTMVVHDESPVTTRLLREAITPRPNVVLAIGETAARVARRHIKDVPIVYAMVPAPGDLGLDSANMCGVPLNGGFEEQMEHLRHVAPDARLIGTVYQPGRMDTCLKELREAAGQAGIEVAAAGARSGDEEGLDQALLALESEPIDAFIVLMEPELVDAEGFERIAAFAARRNVVLAVPDPSLARAEKSFSFSPSFWEMGAFAGSLVRRIVEGKAEPSEIGAVYPDRSTMTASHLERQEPEELLVRGGETAPPGRSTNQE